MAGAPDEEREALSPGACYLVGRPSKEDAAVDLVKVMKKRSVRVKIQGVVRVQVTTGESEMSVGREGALTFSHRVQQSVFTSVSL